MGFEWRDLGAAGALAPNGVVLTSFPSAGLAATVAAHYMVRSLNLPRVGLLESADVQPIAVVQGGVVSPPIRVYGRPDLAVVLSEFPPTPGAAAPIAEAIMSGAERRKARLIICLEGVFPHPTDEEPSRPRTPDGEQTWVVLGRPDPAQLAAWTAAKANPLEDGVIGGVTGALLVMAIARGPPVASILVSAEATEGVPDHRAGAALIETLDRFLPQLAIDTAPLRTQAELIEKALRQAIRSRAKVSDEPRPGPAPSIYQ
ncbi:MAG: PAC2 family protein [Thermoplasmata archaeon]|nr:PAC2 family protein [Thermoplasmata archaeon]